MQAGAKGQGGEVDRQWGTDRVCGVDQAAEGDGWALGQCWPSVLGGGLGRVSPMPGGHLCPSHAPLALPEPWAPSTASSAPFFS